MQYCPLCNKVYPIDAVDCPCESSSYRQRDLKVLPIEPVCKVCGSSVDLTYRESWTGIYGTYGNECTCAVCVKKAMDSIAREEAMKYLVLDSYRDEDVFCNDKEEVEEHFKYYMDEPYEHEGSMKEIIILKLELVTGKVTAELFKPPQHSPCFLGWRIVPGGRSD